MRRPEVASASLPTRRATFAGAATSRSLEVIVAVPGVSVVNDSRCGSGRPALSEAVRHPAVCKTCATRLVPCAGLALAGRCANGSATRPVDFRRLRRTDLSRVADIDRTEHVHALYEQRAALNW